MFLIAKEMPVKNINLYNLTNSYYIFRHFKHLDTFNSDISISSLAK
jgi:hypothetical protein